jgi:hypothetical protein
VIKDSLNHARLAIGYWPLTLFALVAYAIFGLALGTNSSIDEAVIAGMVIPATLVIFVTSYFFSRRAGAPNETETGSIGRWFGWGLLSVIPLLLPLIPYVFVVGFEAWSNSATPVWPESIVYVMGSILAMPLLAISTGRAVNADGPKASVIFDYCKGNFGPIVIASFALLLVPNLIADGAFVKFGFDSPSNFASAVLSVVAGTSMLITSILTTGISAAIFRRAEVPSKGNHDGQAG